MDETNTQVKTAQDWFIEIGCGCTGVTFGIILFVAFLALFGASYIAVLFTAPPLERINQFNEFFQERFALVVIAGLLIITVLSGGFGYWLGTVINTARHKNNQAIE